MSRIAAIFQKPQHKALIAYVTVGYPSIEATLETVPLLAESGCDMIELGIPFSDPMADGATIQKASHCALQNGVTPSKCLRIAGELRRKTDIPLLFMTYYNPIFSYGIDSFCRDCSRSGVGGLIVPDLLPEEGSSLEAAGKRNGLDTIYLLAPTSTDERIRLVGRRSGGFIYLVSVAGITGARDRLPSGLGGLVSRVKTITRKPLCVGFGISSPQQAKQVAAIAEGVIIGSRIIQLMEAEDSLAAVAAFIKQTRQALDEA